MRLQDVLGTARVRILASYLVLLLFSALVGGVALRSVLLARAGERVDDALVQETEEFGTLARSGRNPLTGRPFGDDVRRSSTYSSRATSRRRARPSSRSSEGASIARATRPGSTSRPSPRSERRCARGSGSGEFEADGRRIRYLSVPVRADGIERGTFVVTSDLSSEIDQVNSDLRVAAGVALGVFLIASLLAWVVAGRVLAPLRVLRDTARSITESDLTRRIPVKGDDELADLARTFNEMVDRLEDAFGSQKAFISDAGHELRTPITIVRGHLELLENDPKEREETIELVMDELDRMGRLVNDLLLLAKAQRPDFLQPEPFDAGEFTRELFAKASALAERDWRLGEVASGPMVGGQAAAHAGGDEPEPERRQPHGRERRRRARLGNRERQR